MKEVAIVGAGIHKFGRFPDKSYTQIGLEAVRMALKDANMSWTDVQLAYCARCYLPSSTGARIGAMLGKTGISIADVEAACASGGVALKQGVLAVQAGACDIAVVMGVEKMPRGFMEPATLGYEPWQIYLGLTTNPGYWAMNARRHMHEYGITELHLAKVAYKNHRNSVHNPYAMYQKAFTMEEILNSPVVCAPTRLLEVCAPNEGAAALVLCSREKAQKYTSKPVTIAACAHSLPLYSSDFRGPTYQLSARILHPNPCVMTARRAYEQAGISPEDVSVAEVQDTDAFNELIHYEELGFCKAGESGRLIDEGATEIGGRIPVNASGGLISKGEPIGASHLGQLVDLVWQLRGQNGPRQVANARVGLGLVTGAMGHSAITILKR